MAHTDKDERCHCYSAVQGICPHCGSKGNADHRAQCHRDWIRGQRKRERVRRRVRFLMSEWRGSTGRGSRHDVKHRLRRLARRKGKP